MITRTVLRANRYDDSITLMAISQQVSALPGVETAVVAMGTDMNKELLQNVGLMTAEIADIKPTDLVIAIGAQSDAQAESAAAVAESLLEQRGASASTGGGGSSGAAGASPRPASRSIRAAVSADPELGLALISVPGAFAGREARLALEQGLHVMLYSDNVSLESEIALKRQAHEKGLLLMGPDCGTAILDGVGLGFANAVRRGPIGIVAASGTGAQEIASLIDRLGGGISQLIGTGGRDLSPAVGGIMTLDGLGLLQEDPATRVIVLVSKPPAPQVATKVLSFASSGSKPVVVCFLGGDALTMDDAAVQAVSLATGEPEAAVAARLGCGEPVGALPTGPGRKYVRGLFSGGTLCDQTLTILERTLGPVTCNVHPDPARRGGAARSVGHTLVDLGDDEFTRGRPHPMIDATLRRLRLQAEAADPETAIILLDIVLGYGADADPAGSLAGAIAEAVQNGVVVVASVTGTEADPQRLSAQLARLREAGAHVAPTARRAAEVVAASLAPGRRL